MSNYKVKSKLQADAGIFLPQEAINRALQINASGDIEASAVTSTELDLLSGATIDLADTEQDVADLITLSGVAANSTDLGTFTGVTIPDGSDIKEALQALETSVETKVDTEGAQDAVGTILVDSNTIDFTYSDATPSITADARTQLSITSDVSGLKLVNDASTPGNTYYYGTDGSGTKGYFPIPSVGEAGDIPTTSFSGADNQASPADVTGFVFANGVVRSFTASATVIVDATSDLYETFELIGVQKGSSWDMSIASTGDDSQVAFSITSSGQIQYTSATYSGFSSLTIKFRAWAIGV